MILTVGSDEGLRERVAASVRDTRWATAVSSVASVGEAQQVLRSPVPPRVVVVGQSVGVDGAGDVAAAGASMRTPPLVLLVGTPTTELLRQAMRAGVRDVLSADFTGEDLVASLRDAGVQGGGPEAVPGLTVAVFSTKGGVGTSVVASNLAVLLAERSGAATALVDLDLASADQAIMHGLSPRWTIQDIVDGTIALDEESLEQVMVPVEGSPSRLLPGPIDPALAETISASDVGTVIAAVRAQVPIAVLDLASGFDDRTLAALDAADVTVLVSSLDVAALRALSVSLQTMDRLGVDPANVLLALVRADSKSGLVPADVERAVNRSIDAAIPSTRAVPRSVNEGVPIAVSSPRSGVVQALSDLAELLTDRLPATVVTGDTDQGSRGGRFRLGWPRSTSGDSDTEVPAPPASRGAEQTATADDADRAAPDESSEVPAEDSVVRPIRARRVSEPTPSETEDVDDEAAADDPNIKAVSPLDQLPPPNVESDDDEPRRRRRR